ncbi:MAG: efflux RND transporter permease subunit, partial [Spirochaetia bacterium]|nr:efflux RND transporter permease subunit [Spirochaetia bacterium]
MQNSRVSYRERDSIAKTNGEERVTIYVEKAGNANTLAITEKCISIAGALRLAGVRQQVSFNQGEKIREAVNRVTEACFVGGFVVMLVLYGFLGRPRETLVIVLSLPVSVFATFFLMFLSGLELNVMSLSGLALGSGMLIDNSIVVSESIQSHRERLGDSLQAVLEGASNVFAEVIAATLCTLVVFIPLLFTEPETRRLYSGLSVTVVYSLLVSLFVSLTITPCFLYAVMRNENPPPRPRGTMSMREFLSVAASRFASGAPRLFARAFSALAHSARVLGREASVARLVSRYRIAVRPVFRRPYVTLAVPLILLTLMPLVFRTLKKEYFDPLDSGDLEASIDLETGTDLSRTEKIVTDIEGSIRGSGNVKEVTAKIEKWHASLNVKLSDQGRRTGQENVIRDLKARTARFSEAFVYFAGADESSGREFNIDFYGDDLKVLKGFAGDLSTKLRTGIKGVEQAVLRFREPKGEILIEPSRTALARSGTTTSEVGAAVRNFLSGAVITKYYDKDREVDVRFRAGPDVYDTPDKLMSLVVPLTGRSVPLRSVAEFREDTGETKIWRKNKRKSVSITLRLGDASMDKVAEDVEAFFKTVEFPKDTVYGFGEEYEKLKTGQRQMLVSILLSFVILYMLLAALFESLSKPLLILLPVPLTVCGVLVLFAVLRMSLNMGTYIGMIMLGGIATNNSILLVSTVFRRTADLHATGESLIRHVLRAASTRIRPVLMTT